MFFLLFIHPYVIPKVYDFLSLAEQKKKKNTLDRIDVHCINTKWDKRKNKIYLITESVLLHPGIEVAFSPGEPRSCSVVLISTSVECLMECSITSEGINGVSP